MNCNDIGRPPRRRARARKPSAHPENSRDTLCRRLLHRLAFGARAHIKPGKPFHIRRSPGAEAAGGGMRDPDMVGAAVLIGSGLAAAPGLLERIDGAEPIVIVEVAQTAWIDPVAAALKVCFGSGSASEEDSGEDDRMAPMARSGAVVVAAQEARGRYGDHRKAPTAAAFRKYRPLFGVVSSSCRQLPEDLLRARRETDARDF